MRTLIPRILAFLFIGGLVWTVVLANQGKGYWSFLGAIPFGDKLGHVGLVGTLTLLVDLSLRGRLAAGPFRRFYLGTCVVFLLMTVEELSQAFLPNRTLDLLDWLANFAGVILGDRLAHLLLRQKHRPQLD